MMESCQLDRENLNSLWAESSSSNSSLLSDSQLTQPSISEDREHVKVYLRVRPFTATEAQNGESQDCVSVEPPDTVLLRPPSAPPTARLSSDKWDKSFLHTGQRFRFSQVYGPDATQRELFQGTVKDLVQDVLHGGNSLLFTYGVTNAGKTFTFLGPDGDAGILPRSLDAIFSSMEGKVSTGPSVKPQRCREFVSLSEEQRAEEAAFKDNLLQHFKENDKACSSVGSSSGPMRLQGSSLLRQTAEDHPSLQVEADSKFSVWVSFCEIYKENIHDLLAAPGGAARRTPLRLSQDVKGNAFVKDLRWVQVDSAHEAYQVMKLGKKNQSFSSTGINQLSSRSHSIFSIRILRMKDDQCARVVAVSELCLCDLAGSERCAKTQNRGERLKEAGNINASLLILGKCINALRHNQHAKLPQHVPFRESKLTHYLQAFFCGRGKVCMMVNVNQCASTYDETLQVLKFSALAQKVVLLPSRAAPFPPRKPHPNKGARKTLRGSLIGLQSSLEDVQVRQEGRGQRRPVLVLIWGSFLTRELYHRQEDDDDEEKTTAEDMVYESEEEDHEEIEDQVIISQMTHQQQAALLRRLQMALKRERAESMLVETRVREDVSREFSQIFADMQNDFTERLARETQLLEERAEKRLEIFKMMTNKMAACREAEDHEASMSASSSSPLEDRPTSDGPTLQSNAMKPGESSAAEEDKTRLAAELREKCRALLQLEKRVAELQAEVERTLEENASLCREKKELHEVLGGLREERATQEDTIVALEKKLLNTEEALQEVTKSREEAKTALQDLLRRQTKALAALDEAKEPREEVWTPREGACSALDAAKRSKDATPERQRTRREEVGRLLDEVPRLTAALKASQQQVASEMLRAEQASTQLHAAQEHIAALGQELRAALGQRPGKATARESTASEIRTSDPLPVKEDLAHEKLSSELLRESVGLRHAAEEFREQRRMVRDLREQLREGQEASDKQLEEVGRELREREASCRCLRQELGERELTTERLKRELQEASAGRCAAEEDLGRANVALAAQVASSKAEEEKTATLLKDEEVQTEQLHVPAAPIKASQPQADGPNADELESKLREREAQMAALQKKLQEAQARRDEDDVQALHECRQREAERRRELLAAAHEAIQQKDAELEKRALEIAKLKELAKQDSDKVQSLSANLQRNEEDSSDLREKLADYKKQMQQVHKDISSMKEDERLLRQKLSDVERLKKQLQSDLTNRDRTIQQLKAEQPAESKYAETLRLYREARQELEAKQRLVDDMRSALAEQEETQEQMERMLDDKLHLIQELNNEVDKVKEMLRKQNAGHASQCAEALSRDLQLAKEEAMSAHQNMTLFEEKHLTERQKWREEKMALIGQIKEAEDKRNQEMKKFAEDRERYLARQAELEADLHSKEQMMVNWRQERDTLVAALEVQLHKLLASQADKDKIIQQLRDNSERSPPEAGGGVAETESHTTSLKEDGELAGGRRDDADTKGSSGCPSVLESSEISTENGRSSRFPQPEMEISFSPLQPNRMALRRQGDPSAITVKITRSNRKRKSADMDKCHIFRRSKRPTNQPQDEVEAENRRNAKVTPTLSEHQEEQSRSLAPSGSRMARTRKDATLQKIGDFLQSSPTLIGSKAKKMMGLVSASSSSSSIGLRSKKSKRKLFSADISSPMAVPAHPMVGTSLVTQDKQSDHLIIKRRLRSRIGN
ncbi:LOW QUALITY PROTEIN: kinesin-like protein KIF20B [Hippocampus zosterae]|uniref:LOW QUALITY PROTEIN: kinesin-like protein KIF20B n=1 Tax=Hippocampus zosterae TaxID=109293 RepID=UPI00223E8109|nr:LOW QUALITY PROTEIN: kinesin-like protein KIF20B [Hippocampus zosterae]